MPPDNSAPPSMSHRENAPDPPSAESAPLVGVNLTHRAKNRAVTPSGPMAPQRDNPGMSVSGAKAVDMPSFPAIPTGKSAARRTSPRRPSPKRDLAWEGYVVTLGIQRRSEIRLWRASQRKRTRSAVAPVSDTTALFSRGAYPLTWRRTARTCSRRRHFQYFPPLMVSIEIEERDGP